jgi:membrane carboxypeptidase/penicillin-binding protein
MPKPPQIIRFRHRRRAAGQRNPIARLGFGLGLIVSLSVVAVVMAGLAGYAILTADLPSLEIIPVLLEPPDGAWLQPTRLYDRTGTQVIWTVQNPAAADRRYLAVTGDGGEDAFSQSLVEATTASIDPTYWENPGYSLDGWREGAHPTLAQRLVSDLLLNDEPPSLRRNFRERLLAGQLISRYGHAKVLEWYLNSAWYGPSIYGADAAARVYLGKSAVELSVAEAALITAAAETPAINPLDAPQNILDRQKQLIAQLLIQGLITAEQARQALLENLELSTPSEQNPTLLAFANLVIEQVRTQIPGVLIERGGLRIVTSMDYALQLQAQCTLETQVKRLQGQFEELLTADGKPCDAARLLPTLTINLNEVPPGLGANVVVLDPGTGQVLALVGQALPGLDPAHQPGEPAGTLLTPFIYLSAFVRGFNPATLIWDVPQVSQPSDATGNAGRLEDFPGLSVDYHGPARLRTALANDYVGAAVQLAERIGVENVWKTALQFGMVSLGELSSGSNMVESYFNSPVTLLESVHAFSVFANLGMQAGQSLSENSSNIGVGILSPVAVIRVEDSNGQIMVDWSSPQIRPIVSPQLAYLITNVLSDESARWPSLGHPNPLEIGRPAGTRLGRSLDGRQAWMVGFTTQVVVGVWMGTAQPEVAETPPLASAAVWNAIIKYISLTQPIEGWSLPPGITNLEVCDPSGLLPTVVCPSVINEIFQQGSEPTQEDNLYQLMHVNRETGQLATVFTPPELVDQRVYLVVPTWAAPWAEQAGLPVPPVGYDPIYFPQTESSDVHLTGPAMFAHVRRQVTLYGSADDGNFAYYRLQVGQGLYPQNWFLIGEDVNEPVRDDVLGVWDTQGLQGLYVIQLLVVDENQRVQNSILQVTVDNTPPQVKILDPTDGQQLDSLNSGNILIQAQASDDLVLARVEFYLDETLVLTLWQPPLAGLCQAEVGEHTLLVRAFDLAGNTSEQSIRFRVQP